jgi:hypothetical protein
MDSRLVGLVSRHNDVTHSLPVLARLSMQQYLINHNYRSEDLPDPMMVGAELMECESASLRRIWTSTT